MPSISPGQKACPVSPATNCVDCHMPRREIRGNGIFTDHWIRRPGSNGTGPSKIKSTTTPLAPGATYLAPVATFHS